MLRPLCFMIMPFGRKPTQAEAGKGPAEIDFNALWDRGYVPAIKALGYEPVRADQDVGALIINQMLERLYFADLVLADMTVPNGNVYYEVGIRHACKDKGCVLFAADWSRQLFDVAQMRTVRYPLPEGEVTEATAKAIGAAVQDAIPKLASGISPMQQAIKGYPDRVDERAASSMTEQMAQLAAFQASVRAVRAAPRGERMARTQALVAQHGTPPMTPPVALALLTLLRDSAEAPSDWSTVLDFIGSLSPDLVGEPVVREQRALALSNTGKHVEAIAEIEALVDIAGPTPERLGLLGGRYKRLIKSSATPAERSTNLAKSIQQYERGMELDLNDYYCSSNLPRLYRDRNCKGDAERAQAVLQLVIAACDRAVKRGTGDEWVRPTLLAAAFDAGDADKAEEIADQVAEEGAPRWKLDSILGDLEASIGQIKEDERRARLASVVARLKG